MMGGKESVGKCCSPSCSTSFCENLKGCLVLYFIAKKVFLVFILNPHGKIHWDYFFGQAIFGICNIQEQWLLGFCLLFGAIQIVVKINWCAETGY